MNCKKAQSLMLDALYGELSLSNDKALKKHLDSCPQCAQEFSSQRATVSTFQKVDFENPPAALADLVKDIAIREMEQEALFAHPQRSRYWKPALASAAAALLLVVGVIYYLPQAQMSRESDKLASTSQARAIGESADSLDHLKLEEAQSPAPLQQLAAPAEAPAAIVIYPDTEMQQKAAPAGSFRYRRLGESSDADLPLSAAAPPAASAGKKETFFAEPAGEAGSAVFRQKQQVAVPEKMPKITSRSAMSDSVLSDESETDRKSVV